MSEVRRFKAVLHEDEILAHPSPEAYKWSGEVVLATDYDAECQRRVEAEEALEWIAHVNAVDYEYVQKARAYLARYKEDTNGTA